MLKRRVIECVELAEQDAEDRERAKAYKIVKEMMGGIFQGDMPHKIANDFIQKMSDEWRTFWLTAFGRARRMDST